jgi:hypothetical protein
MLQRNLIRIFFSYSNEDKKAVGRLKELLERVGFEVFLAHEDIEPCSEWQTEILKYLKNCDVFIPFLSNNFKNSNWTDQETGIAISLDKFIVSLQVDLPPYGFAGRYQSLKVHKSKTEIDFDKTTEEITKIIFNNEKFKGIMKEFVINSLINSRDYIEANTRASFLNYFNEFTNEEINRICGGTIENDQVYGAFRARRVLRYLIDRYKKFIDPEKYKKLKELL